MAKALQGNKVLSEARSPRNDLKVLGLLLDSVLSVCYGGFPLYTAPLCSGHRGLEEPF